MAIQTMKTEELLNRLLDAGILEENDNNGEVQIAFTSAVDERTTHSDVEESLQERFDQSQREQLSSVATDDPVFVQRCEKIVKEIPEFTFEESIQAAIILDFIEQNPPVAGVPESFLPLTGERLSTALSLVDQAIVYVWLDDCEPCDVMCSEFNAIFPEPPNDIALFAVYGPAESDLLAEKYDITAGPVTLYVDSGSVDARLLGAQYRDAIEDEVENLRQYTKPT